MKAILFLLLSLSAVPLHALPVDLTESDLYARSGFDAAWVKALPGADDPAWKLVPARKGNRSVKVRDLALPGFPRIDYFAIRKNRVVTCTYVTSFELDASDLSKGPLGLYLAQIGQNWEVYLNGKLLASELYPLQDGFLTKERAVREQVVLLHSDILTEGRNILAFRIVGDPFDDRNGMYMRRPYYVDVATSMTARKFDILALVCIGIYVFFGLYHVFLFLIRPRERFNLAYGAFTLAISTFFLMRNGIAFELIEDTLTIKNIELSGLFFILPTFMIFTDLIVREKLSLSTKVMTIINALAIVISFFILRELLLRLIQVLGVYGSLYICIYNMILPLREDTRRKFLRYRDTERHDGVRAWLLAFYKAMLFSIPGNLILGVFVLVATASIDVILLNVGRPVNTSQYGFFVFVIMISGILANRFNRVHRKMEELNATLEMKVEDRTIELQGMMEEQVAMNEELTATRDALWGEMALAKKIQTVLLPQKPVIPGYEIEAYLAPANEVGGDYYDVINTNGRHWIVIGDVSGHGVPAGLVMMMVQTCIHLVLDQHGEICPSELLSIINRTITDNIKRLDDDKYMTINVLACDENGHVVHAGLHQDIVIYRSSDRRVERIETDGMWLGMMADIRPMTGDLAFDFGPGDAMILYTDGITEARLVKTGDESENDELVLYGCNRLAALVGEIGHLSAGEIKKTILESLSGYDCLDDVTLVVIKRLA